MTFITRDSTQFRQMKRTNVMSCFKQGRRIKQILLIGALLLGTTSVNAQEAQETGAEMWDTAKQTFFKVAEHGKWDGYFSGYAKHFSKPADGRINPHIWGGGFGKTLRNEKGDDESLFVIITQDSNWHKQYLAGYSYQWIRKLGSSGLELGGGYAVFIMRRMDIASGTPFPFILPRCHHRHEKKPS